MSERTVEFYRKENGRIPVEEFLDELPMKHREKAIRSLMLLEEFEKEALKLRNSIPEEKRETAFLPYSEWAKKYGKSRASYALYKREVHASVAQFAY